ncbi:hypothetical protein ACFOQM_04500 [Paenibacillus sp. GCM10012307]|uniref:Aspartate/glutamate/uridylate kinase domain-containing protein n=1 Tax=Paenibacillus roseus TaxID=2798579 RepID=A0A934IWG5_9BACL|nr:hypothetical protein [Paenibacillus roseus]MBJ6360571.1 hypothetical protein [Paenibacillus roseus]
MSLSKGLNSIPADVMIKFSGSLLDDIATCAMIVEQLLLINSKKSIIIFPGGGTIDNYIENYASQQKLGKVVMHKSTVLALDQNALIISSYSKEIVPFTTVIECREILKEGKIPVFMPSQAIFVLDPFRYNAVVSSDSMALYFCKMFDLPELILLKSVDGVLDQENKLLRDISFQQLKELQQDLVDELFPYLAEREQVPIMLMNGRRPGVLSDYLLLNRTIIGTLVR